MKKVSIIIPVYNEEKTIIQILKKINLEKKKIKNFIFEIIVINDKSTDKTKELLDKVKNLYDKFLTHDKNYGKEKGTPPPPKKNYDSKRAVFFKALFLSPPTQFKHSIESWIS